MQNCFRLVLVTALAYSGILLPRKRLSDGRRIHSAALEQAAKQNKMVLL